MHGDPNQSYRPRLVCARGRYYDHTVVFNYSVHGVADAVAVRACQWRASEEKPVRRRQKGGCLDVEVYEYVLVCLSAGVVE